MRRQWSVRDLLLFGTWILSSVRLDEKLDFCYFSPEFLSDISHYGKRNKD